MRKLCSLVLIVLLTCLCATVAFSQDFSQTVRGVVTDTDSQLPLIGASVIIMGTNPIIGTTTDVAGQFRLEKIPVGRVNLQISYLGYENITLTNMVVNAGKEVVLNLAMEESVVKMEEIVVKANTKKGAALNEMAVLSARSISVEETKRFAGGFDDPSRILSNFAGVTSTQDGSNDIIVRGNSPKYIQWRLEGVEITNPNHFADQNAVTGGISALNNNLLATSDFYTGAFSPEYGDALSGVYDVKLRAGNNEQREIALGLGLLGTDVMLEGPIKKGYGGSYLLNYKYSTIALISDLGLVQIDGDLKFQDAAFKIVLPSKKLGVFSFFGLGGKSSFLFEDVKPDFWSTPTNATQTAVIREDFEKASYLGNLGMNHTFSITKNSYLKTTLSYANTGIEDDVFIGNKVEDENEEGGFIPDSIADKRLNFKNRINNIAYRGAMTYSHKLNAKNKLQIGTKYTLFEYDYTQESLLDKREEGLYTNAQFKEHISLIRNFISWKHRFNEHLTMVTGFHNMNVLFNNKTTFEPRIALSWQLNKTSVLNAGYGKHSKMESIHNYFAKVEQADGSILEPNRDLDLLKAHHFVLGYEKRFTKNIRAKLELYYQALYKLPVENIDTSFYATINEGWDYRYVELVNEGTGKNYGVELSLERFLNNNYYFLLNASLFNSTYKALEGVKRNTPYNGQYLVNLLVGKEFTKLGKKKNKTLAINGKVFLGGGRKYIPLLRDAAGNLAVDPLKGQFWDYEKAYAQDLEDIYTVNLSISYKIDKRKATHELFLNLDNLTNHKGKINEYYDEQAPNSVGYLAQFGFFPNLLYRVYF